MSDLGSRESSDDTIVLEFVGDIGLTGEFVTPEKALCLQQSLETLRSHLGSCDLRIGNWEAPLAGDGHMNMKKYPRVYTTRETAECFWAWGLDVALLANNHVGDCLEKGFDATIEFLESRGTCVLGTGATPEKASEPLVLNVKGVRVALVNYVSPDTNPNLVDVAGISLNWLDFERSVDEIQRLTKEADVVVVNVHWGDELFRRPNRQQKAQARRWIDLGATLVVGHHPHCLQGHERWGHGHIFYSMGNFVFGGLDGWKGSWPEWCRKTAVARCRVSRSGVSEVELIPLVQSKESLSLDRSTSRVKLQERLDRMLRQEVIVYSRARRREQMWHRYWRAPCFMAQTYGIGWMGRRLFSRVRRSCRHVPCGNGLDT